MTIPEEAPTIVSTIGEGLPSEAIVLTSDGVVFQPPDAEARAAGYVRLSADLVEATDLLREFYLAVADAMSKDPTHHVVADATATIGIAVHTWLKLHNVPLGRQP